MRPGASFVFFMLLLVNAVVFFNRDHFLYTDRVSYNTLYPQLSALPILKIKIVGDSDVVFVLRDISPGKRKWLVHSDDRVDSVFSVNPVVHAKKGLNTYQLSTPSCAEILTARIEYIPAKENNGAAFLGLYRTDASRFSVDDIIRRPELTEACTPIERQKIELLMSDSIGIKSAMTAVEKAERLSIFFHKKIFASRGQPRDSTVGLDAYQAFVAASNGAAIWCGIYTRIFNLFAQSAGIKTRTVEMFQDRKNITGSVHEFNEYFSPEKKQWIAADMMFNNMAYTDGGANYLTGAQVKNAAHNDTAVKMLQAAGDSISAVPIANAEPLFFDLYGREKDLRFYRCTREAYSGSIFNRVKNYVWPRAWFEFYSDSRGAGNRNFYLKQILLVLLLLSGIFTIAASVVKRKVDDRV